MSGVALMTSGVEQLACKESSTTSTGLLLTRTCQLLSQSIYDVVLVCLAACIFGGIHIRSFRSGHCVIFK